MTKKWLILLLVCTIWAPKAFAQDINVGVIYLKPWGMVTKDRKLAGQHIDFFNTLAQRTNLSFNYKILSLPRIKDGLKDGSIDMTVIFRRNEMAPFVSFLGLVMPYNYYLVPPPNTTLDASQIANIKSLGLIEGEEDVAKQCYNGKISTDVKVISAPNYGHLLKMLERKRFEVATIPSKGLKAYLDEMNAGDTLPDNLYILCKNEAYLQVSKKSTNLSDKDLTTLQTALQKMRTDGTIKQIAARYAELM